MFETNPCTTKATRCPAECYGQASCQDLALLGEGMHTPALGICLYRCLETAACEDDGRPLQAGWLCDGENDCVDGSDERGCEYFACQDGWLISERAACNEWTDCVDGSDELECGYFLCADNAMTIEPSQRCDGNLDCSDGSDEEDCP